MQQHYGQAVRLEVSAGCSEHLSDFLLRQFMLPEAALYRACRAGQPGAAAATDRPGGRAPTAVPCLHARPTRATGAGGLHLGAVEARDVLIHQPFESFDGVLAFLREAVLDPQVLAIKQTIYRTGNDSEMMELLREAVRRGKEVTVVVELKARFDEEANINWAERWRRWAPRWCTGWWA